MFCATKIKIRNERNLLNYQNKNGVLWSQARMRIEMRLRCNLVIGNLQLVIGNEQMVIGRWQQKKDNW